MTARQIWSRFLISSGPRARVELMWLVCLEPCWAFIGPSIYLTSRWAKKVLLGRCDIDREK